MDTGTTFINNGHGVMVRKCCASCAYKRFTRAVLTRRCRKHGGNVRPSDCCGEWKMSRQLKTAGLSHGVVRDIETKVVVIK